MSWCFGCCAYQSGSMDFEPWSLSCFLWSWWRFSRADNPYEQWNFRAPGCLGIYKYIHIYIYYIYMEDAILPSFFWLLLSPKNSFYINSPTFFTSTLKDWLKIAKKFRRTSKAWPRDPIFFPGVVPGIIFGEWGVGFKLRITSKLMKSRHVNRADPFSAFF